VDVTLVKNVDGVNATRRQSVNSVRDNKYYKKNPTRTWLINNNFKYSRIFSDEEQTVYTHRFPVHKYGCFVTLECEIQMDVSNGRIIDINVYDYGSRSLYAPFYYSEYGNYTLMLNSINNKILNKFKKLGIQKKNSRRRKKHGNKS